LTGPGGGGGINKKAMNELDAEQGGDMAAVIVIDDENEEIGVRMGDQGARGGESDFEATSVEVGREVRILGVEPFPSSLWLSWSLFQVVRGVEPFPRSSWLSKVCSTSFLTTNYVRSKRGGVKALSVCRQTRVCGGGGADGLEQGRECAF
jgi:hypothetical protein